MNLFSILSHMCLLDSAFGKFKGPQNINELVNKIYKGKPDTPKFTPLPSTPNVAVAGNSTALLKLMDLKISHYPIKKGTVAFSITNFLTKTLPQESKMEIISFIDGEPFYDGSLAVCDYLKYAKLDCPLEAYNATKVNTHVLQVPEQAENGRLSFIAIVYTPKDEIVAQIAGIMDLEQDGTFADADEFEKTHKEL